jgi:hypothetical protein
MGREGRRVRTNLPVEPFDDIIWEWDTLHHRPEHLRVAMPHGFRNQSTHSHITYSTLVRIRS